MQQSQRIIPIPHPPREPQHFRCWKDRHNRHGRKVRKSRQPNVITFEWTPTELAGVRL